MRSYDIGLSALQTHQRTLSVIGNNIANAATPGYHRQVAHLVNRRPALDGKYMLGTGVEIGHIERVSNAATDDAIMRNEAVRGLVSEELLMASDIETLLQTGDSSLHARFSDFFNSLESVANSPETSTVRRELVAAGQQLMYQFRSIQESLLEHSDSRLAVVDATIEEINNSLDEAAELNRELRVAQALGTETGDLLDRRDAILTKLSEYTDIAVQRDPTGRDIIVVGGGVVSIGEVASHLEYRETSDGWAVFVEGAAHEMTFPSGKLRGLLNSVNETIPDALERLENLANTIVQAVDHQHAQGLTNNGGFHSVRSHRRVDEFTVPIAYSGVEFPIHRGEITLTVTEGASGNRSSHRISIDPFTETMEDLVAKLDAVNGVSAFLDESTGGLTISGIGSNTIDFAGRIDNVPDLSSYTGTAEISFGGEHYGDRNDEYTVSFSGAGTIGATPGLTATVTNRVGQTVATVNIGADYEPGTAIALSEGLTLQFGNGTVAATDTASILTTAEPDTTGILAALGINSLFSGTGIAGFEIREDIEASPDLFAMSSTGNTGESGNAAAMANLRDLRFDSLNDKRFIEELADFTADAGVEVVNLTNQLDQLDTYGQRLAEQQSSESGVNMEEEFLQMLEVERAYQAAARFLSTVDETLDEVFRILG